MRACVLQVAGAHGSAPGSSARLSWPYFRAFALVLYGLKLCCGWRCAIVEPSVRGPSMCVWCCPHAHPSPAQAFCTCSGQVARRSGGAKNLRQIQEWPKNGVFRCACRAHTLALSTIRAHMAERGVLALCLQAPGETAAAMHRFCRPRFCPRFCPRCHSHCHLSALTPPPPSPASAYPRGRPSSLWLASGYHQGAGLNVGALCTRCAPAHKAERSRASQLRKGKVAFKRVLVCACCRMM